MIKENMDFSVALKQAQQLGYAEANPAADVTIGGFFRVAEKFNYKACLRRFLVRPHQTARPKQNAAKITRHNYRRIMNRIDSGDKK